MSTSRLSKRAIRLSSAHLDDLFTKQHIELVSGGWDKATFPFIHNLPEASRGNGSVYISLPIGGGRANVGKSSLLNALVNRHKLFSTSKQAGHTRKLQFCRVGDGNGHLVVVDAPGYGDRGRREWGEVFSDYLEKRKTLKRVFILINAKHGVTDYDTHMLQHLRTFFPSPSPSPFSGTPQSAFTVQPVLTKVDDMPSSKLQDNVEAIRRDLLSEAPFCLGALLTSTRMPFGLSELRREIWGACWGWEEAVKRGERLQVGKT